jgi:tRNA(fMet)-specific endonuclease VapC
MICVVTVGELLSLARQFNWGRAKQNDLQSIINEIVCLDINHPDILEAYGEVDHFSRVSGHKMGKNDAWIAATAKVTNTTLLTTDHDFDHLEGDHIHRVWIDPLSK